ncbi:MAG: DUF6575 domain-containing protein [Snowella sp.]|nr:DUF6575 domain-containing protein [Snowella sp.]
METYLPKSTLLGILRLIEVYEFYDQPCLFSCQNLSGQIYIGLWVDSSETGDIWIYAPVSGERFNKIKNGEIDLRTVFTQSEDAFVFEVTIPFEQDKQTTVKAIAVRDLTDEYLPEANQFIQSEVLM